MVLECEEGPKLLSLVTYWLLKLWWALWRCSNPCLVGVRGARTKMATPSAIVQRGGGGNLFRREEWLQQHPRLAYPLKGVGGYMYVYMLLEKKQICYTSIFERIYT